MKKMRLVYDYLTYHNVKGVIFIIPVQSIYEAALIKCNLGLTDLKKNEYGVTPLYENCFTLEVCLNEEEDEWADWYDEDGNDSIEDWLKEHEPEHYTHIKELLGYYQDFENEF